MGTEKSWPSLRPGSESFALGHTALTANATWCLTDYTEEDGRWPMFLDRINRTPIRTTPEIKLCRPFAPRAL